MAEILIKGMEMPKSCGECKFCLIRQAASLCESEMFCFLTEKELCLYKNRESINNIRIGDCPLVKVPTHGRLIDADVLKETLMKSAYPEQREWYFAEACQFIDEAPTIIEASKEGE